MYCCKMRLFLHVTELTNGITDNSKTSAIEKNYGCEINYNKGWLIKKNAKDKHGPQVNSVIHFSEIPHQKQVKSCTAEINWLVPIQHTSFHWSYFQTDCKTWAEK